MLKKELYHDTKEDVFYLVDFLNKKYMEVGRKGSLHYDFCQQLPSISWDGKSDNEGEKSQKKNVLQSFQKVSSFQ